MTLACPCGSTAVTLVGVGVALVETVAVGNVASDGGPSRICIDGSREHTRGRVCVEADGGIYLAIEAERRRGAAAEAPAEGDQ